MKLQILKCGDSILFLLPLVLTLFILFSGDFINLLLLITTCELLIILTSLVKLWFHIIIIIILIEFLGLKLFLLTVCLLNLYLNNIFLILLLVFIVIEASLGIGLVGTLSRLSSNQSIKM